MPVTQTLYPASMRIFLMACLLCAVAQAQSPWELESSGTTASLRGIQNVGGGVAWASGTNGTVVRSEDTGYLWQQCTTPPNAANLDFRAIQAWDAQTILAMSSGPGNKSQLFLSTDGCTSWKQLLTNTDPTGFWDGMLFLDRKHGILYGDPVKGVLPMLTTSDGGATWRLDPTSPHGLPGESLFAASNSSLTTQAGHFWMGTSKARVWFRGGKGTWTPVPTPLASGNDSSGVFSVAFRDSLHGVAVGGDFRHPAESNHTAALTSDGGKHWSPARTMPHGYRSGVAWDDQDRAWITVGTNGSDISYDDGATWQWLDGGSWNAISLPWAVGPNGQIGKLGMVRPPQKATAGSASH
jgi:photosystem II stability/assembly factor-like uncharacterized protein